jgi:hypothetical protein
VTCFDLAAEDYAATYMPVSGCAQRMNLSVEQVQRLIKLHVLRTRYAWGDVMVQPACVSG